VAEEIVQKILWTSTAKSTFNHIVKYLQENWTEREVGKLVTQTTEMLATQKC
jgi:plasmid stabilization system protein ParE